MKFFPDEMSCPVAEFALERQMLWMDMLPELQGYAFNSGFDIEWIDPLSERGHLTETMVDRIMAGVEADDSWLIVSLLRVFSHERAISMVFVRTAAIFVYELTALAGIAAESQ